MKPKKIWIADSNESSRETYQKILGSRYKLIFFNSIDDFSYAISKINKDGIDSDILPDLIVTEVRFSDGLLLELIGHKEDLIKFFGAPFMIISQYDDIDVLRYCLENGAVDYLVKPIQTNEILVKIERALLTSPVSSIRLMDSDIDQNLINQLTMKELKILQTLWNSPEKTCSKTEIYTTVWNGVTVGSRTLDVHLHNLRSKIKKYGMNIISREPGHSTLIKDVGNLISTSMAS